MAPSAIPRVMCTLLPYAAVPGLCNLCGKRLTGNRSRWCSVRCNNANRANHRWTQARAAAKRAGGNRCCICKSTERIEVNHIVPRNGAGYGWGCWNHPENLEVLCHVCHVRVTNYQAVLRRIGEIA